MNKYLLIAAGISMILLIHAESLFACEVFLSCESVQAIHVGKGRRHLAGGITKTFFSADVDVDTTTSNLKEIFAACPHDSIVIRIDIAVFDLPKAGISPAGNWFGVIRSTPEEALDAAMGICPEKVISHLP